MTAVQARRFAGRSEAATRAPARYGRGLRICYLAMATLGINQFLDVADVPMSDLLFMLAAGVVGIDLLQGRTKRLAPVDQRRTPPVVLIGVLLLLTTGVISSLWALDPALSMTSLVRFLWTTAVWLWLMRSVCPTRAELVHLIDGFKVTLLISCGAALAGQFGLLPLHPENFERRQAGLFGHPNDLAGLLAVGMPFVLLALPSDAGQRYAWLRRLAFVGLMGFAITTTGSMSGIIAMLVGVAVFGAVRFARGGPATLLRHPLRLIVLVSLTVGGLVYVSGSDLPAFERFSRFLQGDGYVQGSVDARRDLNQYVIENFDDFLVIGIGPSIGEIDPTSDLGYAVEATAGGGVHNLYLKTLLEFGLFGLVGLGVILLSLARRVARVTRPPAHPDAQALATACLASLTAAIVFGFFAPIAYQRYFWVPVGLAGVMWAVERHERMVRARQAGLANGRGHGNGRGRGRPDGPSGSNGNDPAGPGPHPAHDDGDVGPTAGLPATLPAR